MFVPIIRVRIAGLMHLADIGVDNLIEMIRFFSTLILNADESRKI
jgi:hypothetical protein